jgi:hypothetical protein
VNAAIATAIMQAATSISMSHALFSMTKSIT